MWVTFNDGTAGYVEAKAAEDAMRIGQEKTGKEPFSAERLPYPARPIIHQEPPRDGWPVCPPFCYTPKKCAGRGSCPHRYACSE
jgi:hypothetical protein